MTTAITADAPATPIAGDAGPWEGRGAAVLMHPQEVGPDDVAVRLAASRPGLQAMLARVQARLDAAAREARDRVKATPEYAAFARERDRASRAGRELAEAERALAGAEQARDALLAGDADRDALLAANRAAVEAEALVRTLSQLCDRARDAERLAKVRLRKAALPHVERAASAVRDEVLAEAAAVEGEALARLGAAFLDRAALALLAAHHLDQQGGYARFRGALETSLFGRPPVDCPTPDPDALPPDGDEFASSSWSASVLSPF